MTADLWEKLVVTVPAATAVIITVRLFLRRMKESQETGHSVATNMQQAFEKQLERSYEVHEKIMQSHAVANQQALERLGHQLEVSIRKQEQTIQAIQDLGRKESQ